MKNCIKDFIDSVKELEAAKTAGERIRINQINETVLLDLGYERNVEGLEEKYKKLIKEVEDIKAEQQQIMESSRKEICDNFDSLCQEFYITNDDMAKLLFLETGKRWKAIDMFPSLYNISGRITEFYVGKALVSETSGYFALKYFADVKKVGDVDRNEIQLVGLGHVNDEKQAAEIQDRYDNINWFELYLNRLLKKDTTSDWRKGEEINWNIVERAIEKYLNSKIENEGSEEGQM